MTLVGLGLMAGSLALRLKADGTCRRLVALVRRERAALEAMQQGVVDWATTDPAAALAEADLVIFATPVRVLQQQLLAYAPHFKPGAVITDMGSTKRVISEALATLPPEVRPVGSHPMCGKEISGLAAADPTLYEGATWVISPLERSPAAAVALIQHLALSVGAVPLEIDAARHDQLVAAISHMPYLLSAALVLAAQDVAAEDDLVWRVAASGFRDTSRIAASQVDMMLDILLTNRDAVGTMVHNLRQQLDALAADLAAGNEAELRARLDQARRQRKALYR